MGLLRLAAGLELAAAAGVELVELFVVSLAGSGAAVGWVDAGGWLATGFRAPHPEITSARKSRGAGCRARNTQTATSLKRSQQ